MNRYNCREVTPIAYKKISLKVLVGWVPTHYHDTQTCVEVDLNRLKEKLQLFEGAYNRSLSVSPYELIANYDINDIILIFSCCSVVDVDDLHAGNLVLV